MQKIKRLVARSNTDHAGCLRTRKSTSSVHLMHGVNLCKAVCATQGVIGLSSGENEFQGTVKAAAVGLGMKQVCHELHQQVDLTVETDSSAAKGILQRRGVGKIRHLHCPLLWVQQKVYTQELSIRKVRGKTNTPDLGTKHLGAKDMWSILHALNFGKRDGSSKLAKEISVMSLELVAAITLWLSSFQPMRPSQSVF